jgi:hypothetical protein
MSNTKESKDEHQLVGRYANFFQVGHTAFEFVIDFGQLYQGETAEQLHTRIVTSPAYATELLRLLDESVEQYERDFGPISKAGVELKDDAQRH